METHTSEFQVLLVATLTKTAQWKHEDRHVDQWIFTSVITGFVFFCKSTKMGSNKVPSTNVGKLDMRTQNDKLDLPYTMKTELNYLEITYLIRAYCPEHVKRSYNSIKEKDILIQSEQWI